MKLNIKQTLKDINKYLDDTPRSSEFSSASNSRSQLPLVEDCYGVAVPIEQEYRARLKKRPKDKAGEQISEKVMQCKITKLQKDVEHIEEHQHESVT